MLYNPVIALLAGSSSIAATFSWIEPARPYLIGLSVTALALAWYPKLKRQNPNNCGSAADEKPMFTQSKTFLLMVTIFAAVMIASPYYSKIFFQKAEKQIIFC